MLYLCRCTLNNGSKMMITRPTLHSTRHLGRRREPLPEPNDGLPDSRRPNGLCPRCGRLATFTVVGSLPLTFDPDRGVQMLDGSIEPSVMDRVTVLRCLGCNQSVAVFEEEWAGDEPSRLNKFGGPVHFRGFHSWPLPEIALPEDVPVAIADAFAEASLALAAGCPRAAAVMARRTLEVVVTEHGESVGPLKTRIDLLVGKGALPTALGEWATEVRLAGNVGAHFDPLETVDPENAREVLAFLREMLRYLYEVPAQIARRRGAR